MLQQTWSMRLIRFSAIFGLVGAVLGSHMAGSGSYAFRPIHAHIVLVSWLSVFAWGAFYRMYEVRAKKLISLQGWSAMIEYSINRLTQVKECHYSVSYMTKMD